MITDRGRDRLLGRGIRAQVGDLRSSECEDDAMTTTRSVWAVIDSPVGGLLLTADGNRLTGIYFDGHRAGVDARPSAARRGHEAPDDPVLAVAATQLGEYFALERTAFELPLDPGGTGFQRRVWTALLDVPYGRTASYGQIATQLGLLPSASRAVGTANGQNPISIVVPCHRIIGADGSLTGYGGGLDRKRFLLDLEQGVLF
jgi:methylated-DNA-[protein]-cysteine S-methyltransferase